jgi:hypothetical protein
VYGATFNGEPMQIQSTPTDTLESQPLNFKADLLDVSTSGEMALSLARDFSVLWVPTGRLAKAPLGGGATRELLDNVTDADWNPDGSELAIARRVDGEFRLEYPPGKVLYKTWGYISDLRFSPAGDQIAFLDHPIYGDDRGDVALIDLKGKRKILDSGYASAQGLAWAPKGKEIWFTAQQGSDSNSLRAVDLQGRRRVIAEGPARMHLQDVSPDGKVLLTSELLRWQVGVMDKKTGQSRDLTAFQWPTIEGYSHDGSMILLNSYDVMSNGNYRLYLQHADGSPPVLIGEGAGTGFSADGKWVTAVSPLDSKRASIIPTGVGETRALEAPKGTEYLGVALLPDGKRLLISVVGAGELPHSAIQDLESGAVTTVGPAGRYVPLFAGRLSPGPSPDGKYCILTDSKSHYWLQPLEGGEETEIQGVNPGDQLVEWHDDSNNLFVSRFLGADVEVDNLNLTTGERKLWTRFSPSDKTAIAGNTLVLITPDGEHYAYQVQRIYSILFLADGLR